MHTWSCTFHVPDSLDLTQGAPLSPKGVNIDYEIKTWAADQNVTISFRNNRAGHGGVHCQNVITSSMGPSKTNDAEFLSYTFELPSDVPLSDHTVLSWSWINTIGSREYYMNRTDVAIKSKSMSFSVPEMLIANYDSRYLIITKFAGNYETDLNSLSVTPQPPNKTKQTSTIEDDPKIMIDVCGIPIQET
ncbi:hypothetical protein BB560_002079 [Smittium megazygosporum]|uniref:Chitin-binding type-4 domain-containing protein n=1 Tax=Smittium megazygosporum TaxID=133381 RepID=A0A2T9ZFZ0_9FUNG|nr:hypothetical protein BB560_002079 [Smittium megazygosporum]